MAASRVMSTAASTGLGRATFSLHPIQIRTPFHVNPTFTRVSYRSIAHLPSPTITGETFCRHHAPCFIVIGTRREATAGDVPSTGQRQRRSTSVIRRPPKVFHIVHWAWRIRKSTSLGFVELSLWTLWRTKWRIFWPGFRGLSARASAAAQHRSGRR
jgi:hypothetical protein